MDYKNFDINFDLKDKVTIITGGASGIGKAIAEMFAAKGAKIAILDIHEEVETIAKEIHSDNVVGIKTDITSNEANKIALQKVVDKFKQVDILVNSAGVALLDDAENLSNSYWDKTISLNLTAPFRLSQLVGKQMIEQNKGGAIINLASQAALIALDQHVAYSASKAAIVSMTKSLAVEWAPYKIRVNAISPTVILTELGKKAWAGEKGEKAKSEIPLRRFGYPEEVAAVATFLASDATSLITGENIVIDGEIGRAHV